MSGGLVIGGLRPPNRASELSAKNTRQFPSRNFPSQFLRNGRAPSKVAIFTPDEAGLTAHRRGRSTYQADTLPRKQLPDSGQVSVGHDKKVYARYERYL
ncbi:hypothetical protein N7517_009933 [Penicillium concentricum]|uniref:Uncharacterized protein n=1 Tax=Penicillium concentricum TaxID=293559 RepID=A0A9W9RI66_9EURO|nr:uncharacterized protein N7517_009933 [Penicillium concentricum]KAJ5360742.1 hypothetical protein N7517_009933 [Penicillium concentricum]